MSPTDEVAEPTAPEVHEGISVDDQGIMHFATADVFFATIAKVTKMSPAELDAWEDSHGFVSHRREFDRAMREVMAATSPQAAEATLSKSRDVVSVGGDEARPSIRALGYSALSNRAGLFYVDSTLHKVVGDVVLSVADGKLSSVERSLAAMKSGAFAVTSQVMEIAPGVRAVSYVGEKAKDGGESSQAACAAAYSGALSTSDRRVEVNLNAYTYYASDCCNYYFWYGVELVARGFKKNFWGSWVSYDTSYNYDSFEFGADYPYVTGSHTGPNGLPVSDFAYASGVFSIGSGASSSDSSGWIWGWTFGHTLTNAAPQPLGFNQIKVRTKSRGTGEGGWVKFCCNYPNLYDCGFSSPPPPPGGGGGGGQCPSLSSGSSTNPSSVPVDPPCPV